MRLCSRYIFWWLTFALILSVFVQLFFVVNKKPVIFGTQRFCALFFPSNTNDWYARVPMTWGGRSGPSHLVAVVGSVAPPEKLDSRGGKRGRGFGRAWGRMDNRRLTREEGEVLSDSEAGAQASGGDQPEGGDLATLHQLLVKTLQTQEREALKQDQRWKGVQIQLHDYNLSANEHLTLGNNGHSGE